MSSEDDEELSDRSREGELLLAEFRRLQGEARDAIRAARDENAAYLGELRDATQHLQSSQQQLLTSENTRLVSLRSFMFAQPSHTPHPPHTQAHPRPCFRRWRTPGVAVKAPSAGAPRRERGAGSVRVCWENAGARASDASTQKSLFFFLETGQPFVLSSRDPGHRRGTRTLLETTLSSSTF